MLAVLEVLETKPSRDVTLHLLKIVNMVGTVQKFPPDISSICALEGCYGRYERNGTHLFDWWHTCHDG